MLEALRLTPAEYGNHHVIQPITGFRVSRLGDPCVEVEYGATVSYGILRAEFDHVLLRRSGAHLVLGEPVRSIRRVGRAWVIDDRLTARVLVGAGGHFCPVARHLGARPRSESVIAAQEIEVPLRRRERHGLMLEPSVPELYFCPDLAGYGWRFGKGDRTNVGFGRVAGAGFRDRALAFKRHLATRGLLPEAAEAAWKGHAYLLADRATRRVCDEDVLLVGDAAGLAHPQSGEGIRGAVESGLLAARAIADGLSSNGTAGYAEALADVRLARTEAPGWLARVPTSLHAMLAGVALHHEPLARMMLDRCFLGRTVPEDS